MDAAQSLLSALTLTCLRHLADSAVVVGEDNVLCTEWRMARVGDVALLEKPADDALPKRIDAYEIIEHSASGRAFKLDAAHQLFSLRWKHNAEPPDFELVLHDGSRDWINTANLVLLGALRRRAPEAIDWDAMGDAVPVLDAFEAAMASAARQH